MHVTTFTDSNHRVLDDSNTYNVDLSAKKCSCLWFQERLLPCSHAMAVLMALDRQDDVIDFSHECYQIIKTMQVYSQEFHPVDMNQVVVRELAPFDAPPIRGAPAIARVRIHARRHRAVAEAARKCRTCGLTGHYAKTCGRQRRRTN